MFFHLVVDLSFNGGPLKPGNEIKRNLKMVRITEMFSA